MAVIRTGDVWSLQQGERVLLSIQRVPQYKSATLSFSNMVIHSTRLRPRLPHTYAGRISRFRLASGLERAKRLYGPAISALSTYELIQNTGRDYPTMKKDFLSILDLTTADLERCLDVATELKRRRAEGQGAPTASLLAGQHVALLFDKPSLRTRATFEIAVRELGGEIINPTVDETLGKRETMADVARNLERWVAAAIIRTFKQERLVEAARATTRLPIINALSDTEHPCQALADMMTLREHWGTLSGRVLTFVGDGNNVATSLVQASAMLGIQVRVASPDGFGLSNRVVDEAIGRNASASVEQFIDPHKAVSGADAVYTDAWTSMGQENESRLRQSTFLPYQANAELMAKAKPGALFLHCLPAHRGEEVTDEVIEAPTSVVFDQAENRLHTEKALLAMLLAV